MHRLENETIADVSVASVMSGAPSSLDVAIYGSNPADDAVSWLPASRIRWIRDAVQSHLEGNVVFARLAAAAHFDVERIQSVQDMPAIPVLSSGLFKKIAIRTQTGSPARACLSSGTRGTQSVVYRDETTIERFVGTVLSGLRKAGLHSNSREGFILAPAVDDSPGTWFTYVLGLTEMLYDTRFYVSEETFRPEALYRDLRTRAADSHPVIVGPPSLVLEFLNWMAYREVRLDLGDADGHVVTAGGWKSFTGHISREELTSRIGEYLRIGPRACRDAFNMVELNTVIFECAERRKHLPPWLTVLVRDPRTLEVLPAGDTGILSYLDPTATSYPCFILSDDFGVLREDPCPCGERGQTLEITRRIAVIEERGCSRKMSHYAVASPVTNPAASPRRENP